MRKSKTVLPVVVCFAVALLIGVFGWFVLDVGGSTRNRSPATRANEPVPEQRHPTGVPLIAEVQTSERDTFDARSVVDPSEPSASALTSESVAVRVVVDGAPWITEVPLGAVEWSDGSTATYAVFDELVHLPSEPKSIAQFGAIEVVGLVGSPNELRPLDATADRRAPAFELSTELVPGALLDWSATVPVADRVSVGVGFGRAVEGAFDSLRHFEVPFSLVSRASGVTLPLRLPRVAHPTAIWVSAPGRAARAFHVAPDTRRIEVILEPAASLRVFHDGEHLSEVVATALVLREDTCAAIRDTEPIKLTDLTATTHDVFIRRNGHELRSHVVRVELVAGQRTDVDLRAETALRERGGVRVLVHESPEVRALAALRRGLSVNLTETTGPQHSRGVSRSVREVSDEGGRSVFESAGFAPGRYVVTVVPFGAVREVEIRAGETSDVEFALDDVGYVRFEYPTDTPKMLSTIDLDGFTTGSAVRSEFWVHGEAARSQPVTCGTYSARATLFPANPWESMDTVSLESDPFVVGRGTTTTVPLRRRETVRVDVVAIDATTGEPISLDATFWERVRIVDTSSNGVLRGTTDHRGMLGASTGVTWTHDRYDGRVRVELPESPFWTFEPIDAVELTDGATITLRATAR